MHTVSTIVVHLANFAPETLTCCCAAIASVEQRRRRDHQLEDALNITRVLVLARLVPRKSAKISRAELRWRAHDDVCGDRRRRELVADVCNTCDFTAISASLWQQNAAWWADCE